MADQDPERAPDSIVFYGNPGGEAAGESVIAGQIEGAAGGVAHPARLAGDNVLVERIGQASRDLSGGLSELGFSAKAARDFANTLLHYHQNPRTEEEADAELEESLQVLQKEFQKDFPAMMGGARGLLNRICRGRPALKELLEENGAAANVDVLRTLAQVWKYRKATGKG